MGEPLNNYDAVKSAVHMLTDSKLFGLSRRHITISTVGVIGRMRQMATDLKVGGLKLMWKLAVGFGWDSAVDLVTNLQ